MGVSKTFRIIYLFIYLFVCLFKKLENMMMETDKSQDLQGKSAPWRPRRANGELMVWLQSKGQEIYDPQRDDVSEGKKKSMS